MKDGIVILDKEKGVTSRKCDNAFQRLFHTKKVGHLGTLDPFATGLLIVAIGKGCKFLPFLPDEEKTYLASLRLGASSSTGDPEGEIEEGFDVPELTDKEVVAALSSFLGESEQLPPMQSAIKIDGKPLYKLAHEGKEIERKKRKIRVSSIRLLSFKDNIIDFSVTASKGTYIRVLGEDIAKKLGTKGYLLSLRRVANGRIGLQYAKKLEEISEDDVLDPTPFLFGYPHVELREDEAIKARNGVRLDLEKDFGEFACLTRGGTAIAIYQKEAGTIYHSYRGLF